MRVYRTMKGLWGFGFGWSSIGWYVEFARWVITNVPG
jgi:hypothetical protein